MGWSFNYVDRGRKAHIEDITGPNHFGSDFTKIESRVVGNHIWQLVKQNSADRTFITLDLIAKDRNGGWGYKGLSEDMGPYHYDCPISLLDKASEPINENAKAWRAKVREIHAAKKAKPKPKPVPGMVVKYGKATYKLVEPWAPRKGWAVVDTETGACFRMRAHQLAQALRNEMVGIVLPRNPSQHSRPLKGNPKGK